MILPIFICLVFSIYLIIEIVFQLFFNGAGFDVALENFINTTKMADRLTQLQDAINMVSF